MVKNKSCNMFVCCNLKKDSKLFKSHEDQVKMTKWFSTIDLKDNKILAKRSCNKQKEKKRMEDGMIGEIIELSRSVTSAFLFHVYDQSLWPVAKTSSSPKPQLTTSLAPDHGARFIARGDLQAMPNSRASRSSFHTIL